MRRRNFLQLTAAIFCGGASAAIAALTRTREEDFREPVRIKAGDVLALWDVEDVLVDGESVKMFCYEADEAAGLARCYAHTLTPDGKTHLVDGGNYVRHGVVEFKLKADPRRPWTVNAPRERYQYKCPTILPRSESHGWALLAPLFFMLTLMLGTSAMALPVDADGWYVYPLREGARKWYVSGAGSDLASGLTPETALRTIAKARTKFLSGRGDQILIEAGYDTRESVSWRGDGFNADYPAVLGWYGDAAKGPPTVRKISAAGPGKYISFVGLKIYDPARDPDSGAFSSTAAAKYMSGLSFAWPGDFVTAEGCVISHFTYNVEMNPGSSSRGKLDNIRLRRNVIAHAYYGSGDKSQGVYISNDGGRIFSEGNIYFRNGYPLSGPAQNVLNHDNYIAEHSGTVTSAGNLFYNPSSDSLQMRPGGRSFRDLHVDCPIATYAGLASSTMEQSVIMGSRDINSSNAALRRGWGLRMDKLPAVTVKQCAFIQKNPGVAAGPAILLEYQDPAGFIGGTTRPIPSAPIIALTENCFYNFNGAIRIKLNSGTFSAIGQKYFQGSASSAAIFDVSNFGGAVRKTFTGNVYWTTSATKFKKDGRTLSAAEWKTLTGDAATMEAPPWPDPSRNLTKYMDSIGIPGGKAEYLRRVQLMSRQRWDKRLEPERVVDFILAGFGIDP